MSRLLPIVVLAFLLVGAPEFPAFERAVAKAFQTTIVTVQAGRAATSQAGLAGQPGSAGTSVPAPATPAKPAAPARGALLPLYVSFAALQALDAHSTLRALNAGASEANPLMGGLAGKPAALVAVKAGLAASTIYLVEKMRLRSRTAAIVLMTALNSAYLTIVAHNYAATP